MDRLQQDMEALGRVRYRFAGTEGEREMLHAVRERLPGADARIEGFVGHGSPALSVGVHAAALLLFGALGYAMPLVGAMLSAIVTLSLVGEGTGRFSLIRSLLPKTPSYNLVSRVRAERPLGAVIVVAPLDAPRWRPRWPAWLHWHRPLQSVVIAAVMAVAPLLLHSPGQPWGLRLLEVYLLSLGVLAAALAIGATAHRHVGSEEADPSGPAVALELARRFQAAPVEGIELWFAFTGCARAHQEGMDALLRLHGRSFPETVLVLVLDDPARPPLQAAISEGSLFSQHHRPTGPALVERLRWAGRMIPSVDLHRVTDARAALVLGYRALALAGGAAPPDLRVAAQAAEAAETLVRWFAEDLTRIADGMDVALNTEEAPLP
ncbi:MAG: hypothetical protein JXX28_03190 [Deltaproteobacteria bacterium]|nr:hypothetical protein [Deltaproteobacteria bacterium]